MTSPAGDASAAGRDVAAPDADPGAADPVGEPGYEAARAELREIVTRLESGGLTLEESLALWERGEQLADICQRWLDTASTRLDEAIARHDAGASGPPDR